MKLLLWVYKQRHESLDFLQLNTWLIQIVGFNAFIVFFINWCRDFFIFYDTQWMHTMKNTLIVSENSKLDILLLNLYSYFSLFVLSECWLMNPSGDELKKLSLEILLTPPSQDFRDSQWQFSKIGTFLFYAPSQ